MTPSVYVIGGAGTGKSTFMQDLLNTYQIQLGEIEDFHSKRNAKALVTLRGHRTLDGGLYLGCMRESFPGTDGLDRASSPTGEQWLEVGGALEHKYIISEGATLATRRFLGAMHKYTDLRLIHLVADDMITDLRFLQRGSTQDARFVQNTVTRSANLARDMEKLGVGVVTIDTEDQQDWWQGIGFAGHHILES